MEGAAAAVAFAQATKECIELGYEIFQRYKAYKHADDQLAELILRTELIWLKTDVQIKILHDIRHELELQPRLLECLQGCLARLQTKLKSARSEIEKLTKHESSQVKLEKIDLGLARSKRARYSLFEGHLRKTIAELEDWQGVFDLSWLSLTIRSTNRRIDSVLIKRSRDTPNITVLDNVRGVRAIIQDIETRGGVRPSIFRECSFVARPASTNKLPYSQLVVTKTSESNQTVLLDTTECPFVAKFHDMEKQIGDLARILMHGQASTLGLLQCLGVLCLTDKKLETKYRFQFIFSSPKLLNRPATLRYLLTASDMSLDTKFGLARTMACGVASVHAAGFVHKNIRPETVLTFQKIDMETRVAFLTGFERFRSVNRETLYIGHMDWNLNLYHHPQRQGIGPDVEFQMQHDIYSLGVCLLEIGLWESFVAQVNPPQTSPLLDISAEVSMNDKVRAAWKIKDKLIKLTSERLPGLMGLAYTAVVMSCLTCLDPAPTGIFGDIKETEDKDGILVGVVFVEKVYRRLLSFHFS